MRDLKDMFDQLHPEDELKKKTLEKMNSSSSISKPFPYRKWILAVTCLVLCLGTIYQIKITSKENFDVLEQDTPKTGHVDIEQVEPYEIKYAKVIAAPREYNGTMDKSIEDTLNYDTNLMDSTNPLTSFYMKSIPSLFKESENKVYSPLSLAYVFGMLDHGLLGTGKEQLEAYLGVTQEELEDYLREVLEDTRYAEGIHLSNSIWIDKKHDVHTETLQSIADMYLASSYSTDFMKQSSMDEIHDYIYSETNGMINLDLETNPDMAILLMNVIAIESNWSIDFTIDPSIKDFNLENGKQVQPDFIKGTNPNANYLKTEQYELVDIPLVNGYNMRVVLPDASSSISSLLQDTTQLQAMIDKKFFTDSSYNCTIHMPKFTITSTFHFNDLLKENGVIDMYQNSQVLQNFGEDLLINDVFQKAYIDVNEEGLRAAAVSGVTMDTMGLIEESEEKVDMILDRPFLYLIQDQSNNVIFMGTLYDPTE